MNTLIFIFIVISPIKGLLGNRSSFYTQEIETLSELPLNKLIEIKSSLVNEQDIEDRNAEIGVSSRELSFNLMPLSMPLRRNNKGPIKRYEDHYDEKGKDTKISKIFQLAVTSLSFLAFGGYLLTLIITAIRRNSTNGNGNVIVFSNLQNLQNYKRPKRNVFVFDPLENDFQTKKLYEGMILLSQAYARYR